MLIFIRHGRTHGNAHGLLQGRVDNPLDALGVRQAEAIAGVLATARNPRVISSSLTRARQTAAALGLAVEVDDRFIELDYGSLDGVPIRDIDPEIWRRWRGDPDFVPGGGESLAALQARVERGCVELALDAADRDVLVFTHVSPIKAAVAWALGMGAATTWRLNVAQASITRIDTGRGMPVLSSFNEEAHLRGL